MTYVPTPLKKEIVIDSIITIHYFEYMRDFVFRGESHDFWEFLYVDRGTVLVTAGESDFQLTTGNIIFHKPKEFHAIRSIGKNSPNLMTASFTSASPAMKLLEGKSIRCPSRSETLFPTFWDLQDSPLQRLFMFHPWNRFC